MFISDIRSKLLSSYCMDLYGCTMWDVSSYYVEQFDAAWHTAIRRLWVLPYTTHCNMLHVTYNTLPIDKLLESGVWSTYGPALISPTVSLNVWWTLALDHIFLFSVKTVIFSYKSDIMPLVWLKPLHHGLNCVKLYITNHVINHRFGYLACDLCIIRDD